MFYESIPKVWRVQRMTIDEFQNSVTLDGPPRGLSLPLVALWWDAKCDWTQAHECAQQAEGSSGAWVHAYLHRKEGDLANADYWYQRAGKTVARGSLEQEWSVITAKLLQSFAD